MTRYFVLFLFAAFILAGCSENIQSPDQADLNKSTTIEKNSRNYSVHLSGDNEFPPVETNAQGQAIFRLNKEGTELYYKLIAANISNVFMAHIHLAAPGANGGIAVWLYPHTPFPLPVTTPPDSWIEGRFSGILAEGVITADDLVGPLAGMSLADLLAAFNSGNAYVNVHTSDFVAPANTGPGDFPGGEIRGNIH
jgi:hypothetical protein